jgi:hypothetical protein
MGFASIFAGLSFCGRGRSTHPTSFVYKPAPPGGFEMFLVHVLGLPLLLIPLLAGYFFNKHVIIHPER